MTDKSGTQELRDLVKDLGKMPKELAREIRPMLRESADRPLQDARNNASWSRKIPGATRITTSFTARAAGVSIKTSRRLAPHSRPYENGGKEGSFRHPVFGNRDVWVTKSARPFLYKAAQPWMEDIDNKIGEVVDSVSSRNGFH